MLVASCVRPFECVHMHAHLCVWVIVRTHACARAAVPLLAVGFKLGSAAPTASRGKAARVHAHTFARTRTHILMCMHAHAHTHARTGL